MAPRFSTPGSKAPIPQPNALNLPWFALLLVWLGYVLLGWQLSSHHFAWEVGAWLAGLILTIICIWGGGAIFRQLRLGPRSIGTMLCLSAAVTVAAVASAIFALLCIIIAAEILTRLEMYARNYSPWQILVVLSFLASVGLTCGWIGGKYWLPSNPFWFSQDLRNLLSELFFQAILGSSV
jgi:Na+/phosphate symporter